MPVDRIFFPCHTSFMGYGAYLFSMLTLGKAFNRAAPLTLFQELPMRRTIIRNAKKNFNSGRKIHKMNRVKPTRGGVRL